MTKCKYSQSLLEVDIYLLLSHIKVSDSWAYRLWDLYQKPRSEFSSHLTQVFHVFGFELGVTPVASLVLRSSASEDLQHLLFWFFSLHTAYRGICYPPNLVSQFS